MHAYIQPINVFYKDLATLGLKKRKKIWFLRLKTLQQDGFNAELNFRNV